VRYRKDAIALVAELYKKRTKLPLILERLVERGFRKRSKESVETLIIKLKKERQRENFEKWAKKNPVKYRAMTLVSGAKQRAKKKGIPFDLTVDHIQDILEEGECQVTGLPFDIQPHQRGRDMTKKAMHAPSLDQIRPSGGYTIDNVQVVVYNYNTLKSNGTDEEALRTARALVVRYGS